MDEVEMVGVGAGGATAERTDANVVAYLGFVPLVRVSAAAAVEIAHLWKGKVRRTVSRLGFSDRGRRVHWIYANRRIWWDKYLDEGRLSKIVEAVVRQFRAGNEGRRARWSRRRGRLGGRRQRQRVGGGLNGGRRGCRVSRTGGRHRVRVITSPALRASDLGGGTSSEVGAADGPLSIGSPFGGRRSIDGVSDKIQGCKTAKLIDTRGPGSPCGEISQRRIERDKREEKKSVIRILILSLLR